MRQLVVIWSYLKWLQDFNLCSRINEGCWLKRFETYRKSECPWTPLDELRQLIGFFLYFVDSICFGEGIGRKNSLMCRFLPLADSSMIHLFGGEKAFKSELFPFGLKGMRVLLAQEQSLDNHLLTRLGLHLRNVFGTAGTLGKRFPFWSGTTRFIPLMDWVGAASSYPLFTLNVITRILERSLVLHSYKTDSWPYLVKASRPICLAIKQDSY